MNPDYIEIYADEEIPEDYEVILTTDEIPVDYTEEADAEAAEGFVYSLRLAGALE
jgi:hypothetical protein